ncbi:MAG: DUF2905 domain-containing protein [Ignavibacteriaceae bacterium]
MSWNNFTEKYYRRSNISKILITTAIILLAAGLLWPWISKLPFGKLPGDIIIDKPAFKIYIPITSMIIVSLIVSFVFWLMKKL